MIGFENVMFGNGSVYRGPFIGAPFTTLQLSPEGRRLADRPSLACTITTNHLIETWWRGKESQAEAQRSSAVAARYHYMPACFCFLPTIIAALGRTGRNTPGRHTPRRTTSAIHPGAPHPWAIRRGAFHPTQRREQPLSPISNSQMQSGTERESV